VRAVLAVTQVVVSFCFRTKKDLAVDDPENSI
jgi:hypothetical protein